MYLSDKTTIFWTHSFNCFTEKNSCFCRTEITVIVFNNAGEWWVAGYRRSTPASRISPLRTASYHEGPDMLLFAQFRFQMYLRYWEVNADIENGGGVCLRIRMSRGRRVEHIWLNRNGRLRSLPTRMCSIFFFHFIYTGVIYFQFNLY